MTYSITIDKVLTDSLNEIWTTRTGDEDMFTKHYLGDNFLYVYFNMGSSRKLSYVDLSSPDPKLIEIIEFKYRIGCCYVVGDVFYYKRHEDTGAQIYFTVNGNQPALLEFSEKILEFLDIHGDRNSISLKHIYGYKDITYFLFFYRPKSNLIICSDPGNIVRKISDAFLCISNLFEFNNVLHLSYSDVKQTRVVNLYTEKTYTIPESVYFGEIKADFSRVCENGLCEYKIGTIYYVDLDQLTDEKQGEIPVVEPLIIIKDNSGYGMTVSKIGNRSVYLDYTNIRIGDDVNSCATYEHNFCSGVKSGRK